MKSVVIFATKLTTMTRKKIGETIAKYRTANKISKYSIVKKTGLTFPQLSAIEAGSKNYTVDSLTEYIGALGLKMSLQ